MCNRQQAAYYGRSLSVTCRLLAAATLAAAAAAAAAADRIRVDDATVGPRWERRTAAPGPADHRPGLMSVTLSACVEIEKQRRQAVCPIDKRRFNFLADPRQIAARRRRHNLVATHC